MLLVPKEAVALPRSHPHCTIHWPENMLVVPETCCGRVVPELRITTVPVPVSWPVKLKERLGETPPPPPLAAWEMYDWEATWILPETGKVASSPPLSNPPLRINPGLPLTPGKLRIAPAVLARSSQLVSIMNESPGKVCRPAAAGFRRRVLFRPFPMS